MIPTWTSIITQFCYHWTHCGSLIGLFQKKKTNRGVEGILFWKTPGFFYFFYLNLWKFQTKQSSTHGSFTKSQSLEIPRPSHQDPWKFNIIFILVTVLNSFCYFFDTPRNSIPILCPFPHPVWFSSGIAHLTVWWRPAG